MEKRSRKKETEKEKKEWKKERGDRERQNVLEVAQNHCYNVKFNFKVQKCNF